MTDDLSDIERAAEAAKQVRNLSELAEFGQRGTASLNSFGHTRLHRLLFDLLPFIALANPARLLALVTELRRLRARNADLEKHMAWRATMDDELEKDANGKTE